MADLLTSGIHTIIANAMADLEDTFAKHTVTIIQAETILSKFDDLDERGTGITLKCLMSPRTNVDESNSMFFDDVGVASKQQLTIYIFKREAIAKGIYTDADALTLNPTDQVVFNGDTYYITQSSAVGFFKTAGELIKIRLNYKLD